MIGILKFKLPEEREEFELAQQGSAWKCVIEEIDNNLRGKVKYEEIESMTIDEIRTLIRKIVEEYELKMF